MDTAEEKVISEESVAGGIFREILYLLLKIVAIATAIVVIFTFIFGVFRYADNAMLPAVKDGLNGFMIVNRMVSALRRESCRNLSGTIRVLIW